MIIQPRIRGFVCVTAHPEGCAANVREQINHVRKGGPYSNAPKKVLIIGASTGYGLATRIATAFGGGAETLGIAFERPGSEDKPASAGWYNTAAFHREADKAGLKAWSLNGDAFSTQMKDDAIALAKEKMGGQFDLVVYSLASPRRDPEGNTWRSCLKPIGQAFDALHLDTDKHQVVTIHAEPASEEEILATQKVMGGEDLALWINALEKAELLAPGVQVVAYDYIGPKCTHPIYHDGTIGKAKEHLYKTAQSIDERLKKSLGGSAFLSVNKAVVTQASSAIPAVPLYISILFKVMKDMGLHEGCIEQIDRLLRTKLRGPGKPEFDDGGRIRMDDWELRDDVQARTNKLWQGINTETLRQQSDYNGYEQEFLKLFGFGIAGVDYEADVNPDIPYEG